MVRAIAVQAEWHPSHYETYADFQAKTRSLMSLAREHMISDGPNLVVLPEDYGTPLIIAASGVKLDQSSDFASAIRGAVLQRLPKLLWRRITAGTSYVRGLFLEYAHDMAREYLGLMTQLAGMYNTFLVPGSILLPELSSDGSLRPFGNSVYNTAFLISPQGRVLGWQRKVHLIELEGPKGLDVAPGKVDWINSLDTEIGSLGLAICLDGFKDDVVTRLIAQGAHVMVQPSANPEKWEDALGHGWENGALGMVQRYEGLLHVINPMMVGEMFGLVFEGISSITAKADSTPDGSGYLARASTEDGEEIVWADIDLLRGTSVEAS